MNIWLYLFIFVSGMMQACGAPMNGQLFKSLQNPWLSAVISFGLIVALLICMLAVFPKPLPTLEGIRNMP